MPPRSFSKGITICVSRLYFCGVRFISGLRILPLGGILDPSRDVFDTLQGPSSIGNIEHADESYIRCEPGQHLDGINVFVGANGIRGVQFRFDGSAWRFSALVGSCGSKSCRVALGQLFLDEGKSIAAIAAGVDVSAVS